MFFHKRTLFSITSFVTISLCALDTSHFYRAQFFPGEPRFERKALTSGSFIFGGGTTAHALNRSGSCVPLLDIYGPFNMKDLGRGVSLDSTDHLDQILINLANLPENNKFGFLSFSAIFDLFEARFSWFQNVDRGFFCGIYFPVRKLSITSVEYKDLSPIDGFPSKSTPIWQEFLDNFSNILTKHTRSLRSIRTDGIGDLGLIAGWTRNEESFDWCDYIDATFWSGVLIPTETSYDPQIVFMLPLGYGGHLVIPIMADFSIGFCNWITIGAHADAHILLPKTMLHPIKTDIRQSGMLKLAQIAVIKSAGTLWSTNLYAKADHLAGGLSLLIGYGYSHQQKSLLTPCTQQSNTLVINSDEALADWSLGTLNLIAEYDFASYETPYAPRVALIYNRVVNGKRIFNTNITGGSCIIEYSWGF